MLLSVLGLGFGLWTYMTRLPADDDLRERVAGVTAKTETDIAPMDPPSHDSARFGTIGSSTSALEGTDVLAFPATITSEREGDQPMLFENKARLRNSILLAQSTLFDEGLSSVRYQKQLLELESLMADSMSDPEIVYRLIEDSIAAVVVEEEIFGRQQDVMQEDLKQSLGFLWAQSDPEASLLFADEMQDARVFEGWLTAHMLGGADVIGTLETYGVTASEESLWNAIREVAQIDTITSLNQVLDIHLEEMNLSKWRDLLFSGHSSSDSVLADWFVENEDILDQSDTFDEVAVIRMLRRNDPGSGPYMISQDLALVDAALAEDDYTAAAGIFEELSSLYGNTIDVSAVSEMPIGWAREDFVAASNWLLMNAERFSEQEAFESMVGSVYRSAVVNGDASAAALTSALSIEDPTIRGVALSNVLIPQVEGQGGEVFPEWAAELEPGFAKQRTLAGYVLGLSRHSGDETLEAQVKFQFLQDQYDLDEIRQMVITSELSAEEKATIQTLFDTY